MYEGGKTTFLFCLVLVLAPSASGGPMDYKETRLTADAEPLQPGPYHPTWQSLGKYEVPQWFRDAKFGIWAHWGPQCEPEFGDWYAVHVRA